MSTAPQTISASGGERDADRRSHIADARMSVRRARSRMTARAPGGVVVSGDGVPSLLLRVLGRRAERASSRQHASRAGGGAGSRSGAGSAQQSARPNHSAARRRLRSSAASRRCAGSPRRRTCARPAAGCAPPPRRRRRRARPAGVPSARRSAGAGAGARSPPNTLSKSQPAGRLSGTSARVRRAPSGRLGVLSTATRLVSRVTRWCSSASARMRWSASSGVTCRSVRATSASAILRRAQSLDRPRPSAALASGSVTIHGRSPIMPLTSSVPASAPSLAASTTGSPR